MEPNQIDYSFMKSGHNILVQPEVSDVEKIKIGALISVFAENAIKSAFQYVEHSSRNGVTTEDIKLAMKLEVFQFLKRTDTQERVDEASKEITEEYFGEEGDEGEEKDELDDSPFMTEDELDTFTKSSCECDHCQKINVVMLNWDSWTPSTDLEKILKKNIDAIDTQ